jgi:hypothetical protein
MTISYTLWQPDTCRCSLIYSWDSDLPEEQREYIVVEKTPDEQHYTKFCEHHSDEQVGESLSDYRSHTENVQKNKVHKIVADEMIPSNVAFFEDAYGRKFKMTPNGKISQIDVLPHDSFSIDYNDQRNLVVDVPPTIDTAGLKKKFEDHPEIDDKNVVVKEK